MRRRFSSLRRALPDLSGDEGASALLIALCMVLLLGFAAVAVDATGLGFNDRRQDQSAADVGALAAVQFAVVDDLGNGCTGTNIDIARCNGASEAIEVANATLDDPTLADWSDSTKCGSPPSGFTAVTGVSPCVAFDSNLQRAWVRIPTITNDTSLGGAVGLNTISTSADAVAGSEYDPPAGVLPFLLPGNAAGADYNCLKASSNPNFGACEDLPTVGNFGSADFFLYGNDFKQWDVKCSGDTNGRLVANIARGVDHPLGVYDPTNPDERQEASLCPIFGAQPNTVDSQTGIGSNLEQGLLYGDTAYAAGPYPGAIQDSSGFTVRNSGGSKAAAIVDDTPLWDYLKTGLGPPCNNVTTPAEMETCINDAKANDTVIFTDDLADSGIRFGWVPELLESDFTGNPYHIVDYRPVYLDTTFYSCSANLCEIIHTPGVADTGACVATPPEPRTTCGTPGNQNKTLAAVAAWVLEADIVPDNAKTPPPGSSNQRQYNLSE
jgi:Flp pilus assembly protein TadG